MINKCSLEGIRGKFLRFMKTVKYYINMVLLFWLLQHIAFKANIPKITLSDIVLAALARILRERKRRKGLRRKKKVPLFTDIMIDYLHISTESVCNQNNNNIKNVLEWEKLHIIYRLKEREGKDDGVGYNEDLRTKSLSKLERISFSA